MRKKLTWMVATVAALTIAFTIAAEHHMSHSGQEGKIQLSIVAVANEEQTVEGNRLFAAHKPWMKGTHHQEGDKARLGTTSRWRRNCPTRSTPNQSRPGTRSSS